MAFETFREFFQHIRIVGCIVTCLTFGDETMSGMALPTINLTVLALGGFPGIPDLIVAG